jgi:hypothetical protein
MIPKPLKTLEVPVLDPDYSVPTARVWLTNDRLAPARKLRVGEYRPDYEHANRKKRTRPRKLFFLDAHDFRAMEYHRVPTPGILQPAEPRNTRHPDRQARVVSSHNSSFGLLHPGSDARECNP